MKKIGRFITLEGGEGVGKSTQAERLAERLKPSVGQVLVTREPGGPPTAEQIRTLLIQDQETGWEPFTESLLHFAARLEHLAKTVWPALDAGQWVISDRFADSTIAYQGYGFNGDLGKINALYALAVGDFAPDLTLILDLSEAETVRRLQTRGVAPDRYEGLSLSFHSRVRNGFRNIAKQNPSRCVLVNADQPIVSMTDVLEAIIRERLLPDG